MPRFSGIPVEQEEVKPRFGGELTEAPAAPPEEESSLMSDVGRQLGLTARYGLQGVLAVPNILAEAPRQLMNLIPGVDLPPTGSALSQALTKLGLPVPETPVERVAQMGSEALAGAGGLVKAGQMIGGAAPVASKILTTSPLTQAEAAAAGGVGAGIAKEEGYGLPAQVGASLVGGLGVPALHRSVTQGVPAAVAWARGTTLQTPVKQKIAKMIEEGSTAKVTAKYKIDPTAKVREKMTVGAPKLVKDRAAIEAMTQGFDEGVVATVKASSPSDKIAMNKMVNIMQRAKDDARYAATNRPSDVVGDSLMKRFKVVYKANRQAGKKLDAVAKSLKGERADSTPAANTFMDDLDNMGITVDDEGLNFANSDIADLDGPINAITRVYNKLRVGSQDAYDLHKLKKFIDEGVSYGKGGDKGLTGKAEGIIKGLRRNIDGILDEKFSAYNRVNTKYAETRGVIDDFQGIAGKKMDLTGPNAEKAVGTLMRRIMSNTQSRVNLLDSINNIEGMAVKHGGKFGDDLLSQVMFADELDRVFGTVARTSLQGQVSQAVERTARTAISPREEAVGLIGKTAEKMRGINEEGAFKSIKALLGSM